MRLLELAFHVRPDLNLERGVAAFVAQRGTPQNQGRLDALRPRRYDLA